MLTAQDIRTNFVAPNILVGGWVQSDLLVLSVERRHVPECDGGADREGEVEGRPGGQVGRQTDLVQASVVGGAAVAGVVSTLCVVAARIAKANQ